MFIACSTPPTQNHNGNISCTAEKQGHLAIAIYWHFQASGLSSQWPMQWFIRFALSLLFTLVFRFHSHNYRHSPVLIVSDMASTSITWRSSILTELILTATALKYRFCFKILIGPFREWNGNGKHGVRGKFWDIVRGGGSEGSRLSNRWRQ